MKKIAPYLVLIAVALSSCTNREILHGSSADKPPSLKVAKRTTASDKPSDNASDKSKADDKDGEADKATKKDDNETESAATGTEKISRAKSSDTSEDAPGPDKEGRLRIWFAKESKGSVQPFAVERKLDKKEPLRSAVNQLLEGPTEDERKSGVKSEVPVGTVLISLKKKDNVVELNLSRRFGAGGVDSIETRLQQLELTIKEVAGHDKVYLDVEGKRLTSAGDGLEVKQPLNL